MVARALVIEHEAGAGPGWFRSWLEAAGIAVDIARPYTGETLPDEIGQDALVVLGGPMGAYDDERAPWLPATRELLRHAVDAGVPTLGLCLGGQLLATACGGRVERGSRGPEVGVVRLVLDAGGDPLLGYLPTTVPVTEWHFDAITELPPGAAPLASSATYPYQAFRLGNSAWGLQGHPEVTASAVAGWARDTAETLGSLGIDAASAANEVAAREDELTGVWSRVARNFAELGLTHEIPAT